MTFIDCISPDAPRLTKAHVSQRLRVSTRTVDRLIARQVIAYHRIGHLVRFSDRDVDAYIESTRVQSAS